MQTKTLRWLRIPDARGWTALLAGIATFVAPLFAEVSHTHEGPVHAGHECEHHGDDSGTADPRVGGRATSLHALSFDDDGPCAACALLALFATVVLDGIAECPAPPDYLGLVAHREGLAASILRSATRARGPPSA